MSRPATPLTGIHHVSAVTANAQQNVDFYTQVLGLRIIKKTVNQDDVSVYHLFYSDADGTAGTDLTFFDIPFAAANRPGTGEVCEIALRVADQAALDFWQRRFAALGVEHNGPPRERFGRRGLTFRDPEGQRLALMADGDSAAIPAGRPWPHPGVPAAHAIRGLASVSLATAREETLGVLTEVMGFRVTAEEADPAHPGRRTVALETGDGGPNGLVYVHVQPDVPRAMPGRGGVHHVAFRTPDAAAHAAWREHVGRAGMRVTPEIDRFYFLAAYFREPGGVLYELSTDGPGFKTDQPEAELGVELALPPFLEPYRERIAPNLAPLDTSAARTQRDPAGPT